MESRKQELVAESEVLRRGLGLYLEPVEQACARVDQGIALARSLRPFWPLAAAAAGFAATRSRGGLWQLLRRGWSLWRLASKAMDFWREQGRDHSPGG